MLDAEAHTQPTEPTYLWKVHGSPPGLNLHDFLVSYRRSARALAALANGVPSKSDANVCIYNSAASAYADGPQSGTGSRQLALASSSNWIQVLLQEQHLLHLFYANERGANSSCMDYYSEMQYTSSHTVALTKRPKRTGSNANTHARTAYNLSIRCCVFRVERTHSCCICI